ncbi:hypothetical protein BV25DRAFT_1819074 [Artomyces pyxidatus]|uniref:Uncharacterized protein n=1 Tax=Artomyces pyxidatus TaxID=48021 RepID=A0ACB8TH02_9AGAM|nr:hypothetical protein BV25DRAFT_1819074 [Artomyces pyxidatus]
MTSVDFGAPFHDTDADLILRSSDSVDFRVHTVVLRKASPIFRDFSLLSPNGTSPVHHPLLRSGGSKDGLPVLCVAEARDVLHGLLSSIFPVKVDVPADIEQAFPLFAAAYKYGMQSGLAVLRSFSSEKNSHLINAHNAFRAYCLACHYKLEEEALKAAALTLDMPLAMEDLAKALLSVVLSGASLHTLRCYRLTVLKAALAGLQLFKSLPSTSQTWQRLAIRRSSKCVVSDGDGTTPFWLARCSRTIASGVLSFADFFLECVEHASASQCVFCNGISTKTARELYDDLRQQVVACLPSVRALACNDNHVHACVPPTIKTPKYFGAPFEKRDADLIIRSSDGVDFRVYKSTMADASPVFEDMLSFPQYPSAGNLSNNDSDFRDGLPVVALTEDAQTLYTLLTVICPVDARLPTTIFDAAPILAVCQKYEMVATASHLRYIVGWGRAPVTAFREYALAVLYRLRDETQDAARRTLGGALPLDGCGVELCIVTGSALYHLAQYRLACRRAVRACILDALQERSPDMSRAAMVLQGAPGPCRDLRVGHPGQAIVPMWWDAHFRGAAQDVLDVQACPDVGLDARRQAFDHALQQHTRMSRCASCRCGVVGRRGHEFIETMQGVISDAIGQVKVDTDWYS